MIYKPKTFTVESVTKGHPDKICDQISDAILDEHLKGDPDSRVAIECFGGHGKLAIGGEITTRSWVSYTKIAKKVYQEIGYKDNLSISLNIVQQSPDIAQGVDSGGAGDQGIMYGYATNETKNMMPQILNDVHTLAEALDEARESGTISWLKPDGKTQITMTGEHIDSILISCQHDPSASEQNITTEITEKLIKQKIKNIPTDTQILINPTGKFEKGGFSADTGLTGRKIMVDTYGGLILHGGGCFSGKDPTKVDRSAAYMARFTAKNIVANGHAKECYVSVAYAIGRAEPLMLEVINEEGKPLDKDLVSKFDFRPQAIIERLDLKRPIYRATSTYGHFGREDFPWEKVEKV